MADKGDGIDPFAVTQHFEMQVRAGGATGFAHQRDRLAFPDFLTNRDKIFGVVRIAGCITVAVVDLDQFAKSIAR